MKEYVKEVLVGISAVIILIAVTGYVTDLYGLRYVGLTIVVGMNASFLFTRKSKVAIVGAVLIFPELLTKILMPKNTRQAIKDLEKKGKDT